MTNCVHLTQQCTEQSSNLAPKSTSEVTAMYNGWRKCLPLEQCSTLQCTGTNVGTPGTMQCTAMHWTVVPSTVLDYITMHCTANHWTALNWKIFSCCPLLCTALHWIVYQYIALQCALLHCTTIHCVEWMVRPSARG